MPAPRRRPLVDDEVRASVPVGQAVTLVVGEGDAAAHATLARTAVTLATAAGGAAVIITRSPHASPALRGARELGIEPRISLPSPGPSLSARTPLTLALQGERASPAFASAAAFVADFVAATAAPSGSPPDAALRAKLIQIIAKAREASRAGLDFAAIASLAAKSLGASSASKPGVAKALGLLEKAEAAARLFGAPASWDTLLAPSPTGRRAAVLIELGRLPTSDAELVEGLALASLAASLEQVESALGGGPIFLVADAPRDALGRFAADRLATWGGSGPPAVFALFVSASAPEPNADFSEARLLPEGIGLPSRDQPLPLSPAPDSLEPLSPEEVRTLTPPALRLRLLGAAAAEEEEATADPVAVMAPSVSAAESQRALLQAAGDLEALAKRRVKPAAKPPVRGGSYEASDFEL